MKLLLENWNKFLNEEDESGSVEAQIKQVVADNRFLSHLAPQVNEKSIKDLANMYYLQFPDQFSSDHMKKHFDRSSAASIWSLPQEQVADLMLKVMQQRPTKSATERGALKHKWLNVDTGQQIGFDSLRKLDPSDPSIKMEDDLEPFGMTDRVKDWSVVSKVAKDNGYELVTQEGEPYTEQDLANNAPSFIRQELGVIPGKKEDNPTSLMNIVVAQIGDVNGKPVVSLMSTYPGHQPIDQAGNDLTNKKDFKDNGYYFIKGN
tara:strand:+ start:8824 stop:9609 length:786 start_codon:yes stop_codon:yes gene_type:complete